MDSAFSIAPLDRRLFGSFVEHLGRCVYTGIFEPGGTRRRMSTASGDVLDSVRELGPTIIRYPGAITCPAASGKAASGQWSPVPRRLDLAWLSAETHVFGTNEFITWCKLARTEPMLGVNLGTRGTRPENTSSIAITREGQNSAICAAHGYKEPHAVKFWCLGNEMDGPWQICRKTATEYGRMAAETGKEMKWVDPTIEVSSCGSSGRWMPTFAAWEYEVLEHTMDTHRLCFLHMYYENPHNEVHEFLANVELMDRFIKETVAIRDVVAARRKSKKQVSFHSTNGTYRTKLVLLNI